MTEVRGGLGDGQLPQQDIPERKIGWAGLGVPGDRPPGVILSVALPLVRGVPIAQQKYRPDLRPRCPGRGRAPVCIRCHLGQILANREAFSCVAIRRKRRPGPRNQIVGRTAGGCGGSRAGSHRSRPPEPAAHGQENQGGKGNEREAGPALRRAVWQRTAGIDPGGDVTPGYRRIQGQQRPDSHGEILIGRTLRQTRPLDLQERIRDMCLGITGVIDHHRQKERPSLRHQVRPLVCQSPLQTEIALGARLGAGRDDRNEERALLDLLPDLGVPGITAAQLALVEPNLHARRAQYIADAPCGDRILGRVGQKNGTAHWRDRKSTRLNSSH